MKDNTIVMFQGDEYYIDGYVSLSGSNNPIAIIIRVSDGYITSVSIKQITAIIKQ